MKYTLCVFCSYRTLVSLQFVEIKRKLIFLLRAVLRVSRIPNHHFINLDEYKFPSSPPLLMDKSS